VKAACFAVPHSRAKKMKKKKNEKKQKNEKKTKK
jgi:hypothetical protein